MSGYNNLKITSAISGRGTIADIDAILDQLKLAHRKNSKFSTYSLGMKQRLAIAGALLGNPSILLLDEPTNGLDPEGIAEIRNLIQQLAAKGTTIIMASHLLDEVEKVCTHVAILKKGELLTSGSIRELMSGEEIIHLAAADLSHLQEILQGYPGISFMKIEGDLLKVHAGRGEIQLEAINQYCFQQGITLRQLTLHKKSLETTFLELTH
jgi:ABC-2 type transport system ATP-binding protein